MDIEKTVKALENNGYRVACFKSAEEAAEWIDGEIDGKVVGFGDSKTIIKMRLYERLARHNTVYDPNQSNGRDEFHEIGRAKNYASPMNALKYDLPTPCVAHFKKTGEYKCFDCNSPTRICNAQVIYQKRMSWLEDAVVVLIDEELGF